MTSLIRYRLEKQPGVHQMTVPCEYTFQSFIDKINAKYGKDYQTVFIISDNASIDLDDEIKDWLPEDPDSVFYIATDEIDQSNLRKCVAEIHGHYDLINDDDRDDEIDATVPIRVMYPTIPKADTESAIAPDVLQTVAGAKINLNYRNRTNNRVDRPDEFLLFSTTNYKNMTEPQKVTFPMNSTYSQVERKVRECYGISPEKKILLYLPTGLPFPKHFGPKNEENKIGNFFSNAVDVKHHIYVVVIRDMPSHLLENKVREVCNISTNEMKLLISPVCQSTKVGYSRMACLLGTFYYNGCKNISFIKAAARCTGFAPLICCLHKMNAREEISGSDLVTVSASLHAIFSKILPKNCDPRHVLERCLECACYILRVPGAEEAELIVPQIPIMKGSTDPYMKYMESIRLKDHFYQYNPDIGRPYEVVFLQKPKSYIIQNIFTNFASYRPVPPLSVRYINITAILQYIKGRTLLFIGESVRAGDRDGSINVIDPFVGEIQKASVENLANDVSKNGENNLENLIHPEHVEEVIEVLFDCSGSMFMDLNRKTAIHRKYDHSTTPPTPVVGDTDRYTIAYQYLVTFLNRSFGYRLPQVFGFISFNDKINVQSDFSPLSPTIEKCLNNVVIQKKSHIWDAINVAIDQLVRFNGDKSKYKNARNRILVFSDGIDLGSTKTPEEVCQKAIRNQIIVDAVIVTIVEECVPLCQLCHLTGGYAFRPENTDVGNALFEKESFLSLKLRPEPFIEKRKITKEIFDNSNKAFDTDIHNQEAITKTMKVGLSTPKWEIKNGVGIHDGIDERKRRMVRELRNSIRVADPDIKLFINSHDFNDWKVYMLGPSGTAYEDHWWYLSISFPFDYPLVPPLFRFITVPYHLNVSEDGIVCASFLGRAYQSNFAVYDLILKVRKLLESPEVETPIQIYKRMIFADNPKLYKREILRSCTNTPDDLEEYFFGVKINDVPKKDGSSEDEVKDEEPPEMIERPANVLIGDDILVKSFDHEGQMLFDYDDDLFL
ncbi:hypothetical protein TRFO_01725 [Tritrichomonas foetus]|uniref:UBC core domain-containing protein n=1 Tax=Tritrichomonas foetus TaxID=1144522 RepID=A0A1J4JRR7_9EUKA|nr:hypothetical protein TRFO_01725 [Tritrichomonas foetus]|eukprot:OHT01128.1 hypothetical protein TRFO_01725 [Tritrichomonas foetus]